MPNGVAYGFVDLQHVFSQRVADVGVQQVYDAITRTTAEWNRQINSLMNEFVQRTDQYQFRYHLPGTGSLQPLDEWGTPTPVREGAFYDVGLPIQGAGTAFGDNRVSREFLTVEEANRQILRVQRDDADWLKRHILATIFTNTSWTFSDPLKGNLTVQPLANGDAITYPMSGLTAMATDQHYLAQAAGILDASNPFPTIRDQLAEHPTNTGTYVAYIPTNLRASVEALATFVEVNDGNIRLGGDQDQLLQVVGPGVGDQVIGYIKGAGIWIIEWRSLPDNYIVAHARGSEPAIAMREYEPPNLKGLIIERHSQDGNLQETRFIRYAGFGVLNRTGMVIQRIGNGTYAIPSGYTAPLAA